MRGRACARADRPCGVWNLQWSARGLPRSHAHSPFLSRVILEKPISGAFCLPGRPRGRKFGRQKFGGQGRTWPLTIQWLSALSRPSNSQGRPLYAIFALFGPRAGPGSVGSARPPVRKMTPNVLSLLQVVSPHKSQVIPKKYLLGPNFAVCPGPNRSIR